MRALANSEFYKNKIKISTRILVVLAAFSYIFYRLYYKSELSDLQLSALWTLKNTIFIVISLLLMPVNWLIESLKWKLALKKIESVSLSLAIQSIFIGLTYAIFTPYRLGEFAGRPILIKKENRLSATLATIVGSISQSITTISMAIIGLAINIILNSQIELFFLNGSITLLSVTILSCLILIYLYFKPSVILNIIQKTGNLNRLKNKLEFLKQYKSSELLIILIYSQLRYLIFFVQYYFLLKIFGIQINIIEAFSAISLSYLFLFSLPGIPLAEIGIRGSLALFFIGKYSGNEIAILSASTCLWIINLAMPSLLGSFFILSHKNNPQNIR